MWGCLCAWSFRACIPPWVSIFSSGASTNCASGQDRTLEIDSAELKSVLVLGNLGFSTELADIAACNIYIVTVPTPIDKYRRPDLRPLLGASESVGKVLKKGDIVIYESTVYPGATEEDCVPVLERLSGLKFNVDFFCGYSPERINPGDKTHTVTQIKKVTSGSTPEIGQRALYRCRPVLPDAEGTGAWL